MEQKQIKSKEESFKEAKKLMGEAKILIEMQEDLHNLEKLLNERLVNPEYIYKKIKILLEKIKSYICPTNQLDIAKNYVKKWSKDLEDAETEESKQLHSNLKELDKYQKLLESERKKNQNENYKPNKDIFLNEELLPKLVDIDYSKKRELLSQFGTMFEFYKFQIKVENELKHLRVGYRTLTFVFYSIKVIIFFLGVCSSYFLGLFLGSILQINPLIITFIGAILLYLIVEKFLFDKISNKFYFNFSRNMFSMVCGSINIFYKLREEFKKINE